MDQKCPEKQDKKSKRDMKNVYNNWIAYSVTHACAILKPMYSTFKKKVQCIQTLLNFSEKVESLTFKRFYWANKCRIYSKRLRVFIDVKEKRSNFNGVF